MTIPPTDSLEAALAKVPLVCRDCGEPATEARPLVCSVMSLHDSVADYPAIAAAARKWMREQLIEPSVLALAMCLGDPDVCLLGDTATIPCRGHRNAASYVMADVALRLGL